MHTHKGVQGWTDLHLLWTADRERVECATLGPLLRLRSTADIQGEGRVGQREIVGWMDSVKKYTLTWLITVLKRSATNLAYTQ